MRNPKHQAPLPSEELGIGSIQAAETQRFLHKDGRFNSRRLGLGWLGSFSPFHVLLTLSWPAFFVLVALLFLLVNLLFAGFYMGCGPDALQMLTDHPLPPFWRSYFFSIETLSTIGYGHIAPTTLSAHLISSLEAFVGLLGVALITGVLFARFARPNTHILWSNHAVVAPFQDGKALMFRVTNGAHNEIIELEAQVFLSKYEEVNGKRARQFYVLPLERAHVPFFSLAWTVVHPINAESPLWGMTEAEFQTSDLELLVLLRGIDDVLQQDIRARHSYKHHEMVWNARFGNLYVHDGQGGAAIDVRKLDEIQRLD